MKLTNNKIALIGLGYVGLPLAVEFGKKYLTVGFDLNETRLNELKDGVDSTRELNKHELSASVNLSFTSSLVDIANSNIYIVTVPTPINEHKKPNLDPLLTASESIGKVLKKGDVVIYESTVYPGATEEECVPVLERISGLEFNKDFFIGYSPERVNPGDKEHRVTNILKITAGSTPEVAEKVDQLYASIISAGTYKVSSIKVAEAAKVIENTQRDVNIGLINELALIFSELGIDTEEVLKAAGTKWNFLPFRPGLVGGHCIGVDPYYLTYKAQSIGYYPEIILAGRRLNDAMGSYVANRLIKEMLKKRIQVNGSKVLLMGITFKENCPDIRNSKIIDVFTELDQYGVNVECYDPWVDSNLVKNEYGIDIIDTPSLNTYDGIILAVAHDQFKTIGATKIRQFGKDTHILYDLKYLLSANEADLRL